MRGPILIVEDDSDTRELLREILEVEGYRVETAADGGKALRLLKSARPQLVLLDLMLPGLSGREIIQAIRADPQLCDLPVVALSASVSRQPLAPGATRFFSKPFRLNELLEAVQELTGPGSSTQPFA